MVQLTKTCEEVFKKLIEEELFNEYEIDESRLIEYGFKKVNGKLEFKKTIFNNFIIIVEYDNKIKGHIKELEFNDEYTNFRRNSLGEFSASIKKEFIDLLMDIRNRCCDKNVFKSPQTKRINEFINNQYKINPEFLWEKLPEYAVYRKIKKWFAVIGYVELNKINKNTNSSEKVEIINLKVSENEIETLLRLNGYFEAFHMNKKHWISIILNDTLSDDIIKNMIIKSYNIVTD